MSFTLWVIKCFAVVGPAVFVNWVSKCIVMLWCHSMLFLCPSSLTPFLPPSPPLLFLMQMSPVRAKVVHSFSNEEMGRGLSGITSHKGSPHTATSSDNRVLEPLIGPSSPFSSEQWPFNRCAECRHCSFQAEIHFWGEGKRREEFDSAFGRTLLCYKNKPFVLQVQQKTCEIKQLM